MQFKKTMSYAMVAAAALASVVEARNLRDDGVPAEVPPESFTGNQYVDSRGCVFIRAGVDGATNWVPRVTRDRKLVCGMQPTNVGGTTVAATVVETPEIIEIEEPATPAVTIASTPVAKPTPKPVVQPTQTRVVQQRRSPVKPVIKPVVEPATPPAAYVAEATQSSTCSHLSPQSQAYLSHATAEVRCGPQNHRIRSTLSAPTSGYAMPGYQDQNGEMVVAGVLPGHIVKQGETPGDTHVIPGHLYQNYQDRNSVSTPPPGYKPIWKDDRLNPNRGVQTLNGHNAMASVWIADRVPMRAHKPGSQPSQTAYGSSGGVTKTMVLTPNAYVQVAAYHSSSDAQRVAKRVRSMGLPVRIGHVSEGYRLVLAGPFNSHAAAQSALSKARSAGFSNAVIR